MWLAVDCGNSRLKWAMVQNGIAGQVRAISLSPRAANFASAIMQLKRAAANASETWMAHVGSALSRKELRAILGGCKTVRFLKSAKKEGGVINRYCSPAALGVDRWLSLIAARELARGDVAVVCAGTAATIDFLRADGVFVGGAILPGVRLAQESIVQKTNLTFAARAPRGIKIPNMISPPQSTKDALAVGTIASVVGAAQFLRRRFLPRARFVVGGGDAELLLPFLPRTAMHLSQLPIRGIVRLHSLRSC